jgi:hypothetical protein
LSPVTRAVFTRSQLRELGKVAAKVSAIDGRDAVACYEVSADQVLARPALTPVFFEGATGEP